MACRSLVGVSHLSVVITQGNLRLCRAHILPQRNTAGDASTYQSSTTPVHFLPVHSTPIRAHIQAFSAGEQAFYAGCLLEPKGKKSNVWLGNFLLPSELDTCWSVRASFSLDDALNVSAVVSLVERDGVCFNVIDM